MRTRQSDSITVWRISIGIVTTSVSRIASTSLARREASSPTRRRFSVAIGRRMMRLKVSRRSAASARSEALANNRMRQNAMKAWTATMPTRNHTLWLSSAIHAGPVAPPIPFPATAASSLMKMIVIPPVIASAMSAGMNTL
jgi:hypothetical protein